MLDFFNKDKLKQLNDNIIISIFQKAGYDITFYQGCITGIKFLIDAMKIQGKESITINDLINFLEDMQDLEGIKDNKELNELIVFLVDDYKKN